MRAAFGLDGGLFDKKSQADNDAWNRRNRIAQSYEVPAGHAWEAIIAANKAEFVAHPEYLALTKQPDGTLMRMGAMLELGNPALRNSCREMGVGSVAC